MFHPDLDNGQVVFAGRSVGLEGGIFLSDPAAGLSRLYDTTMVVPGGNGGTFSNMGRPVLSNGRVAFWSEGGEQTGIYTDVSGSLQYLAHIGTPVPSRPGVLFDGFGFPAIDDGVVAFTGLFGGNRGVYSTHLGSLGKVLAQGDPLDGRIVRDTAIGPQGLSGDSLALWVEFSDGTSGIYRATIPAPGAAGIVALGLALRRNRRHRP